MTKRKEPVNKVTQEQVVAQVMAIAVEEFKSTIDRLEDKYKDDFIQCIKNISLFEIQLRGTNSEKEKKRIERNLAVCNAQLSAFKAIGEINVYNSIINIVGRVIASLGKAVIVAMI